MESFGFWYKLVEDKDDKNPEFDLHVNFFFFLYILKGKVKNPYLDIGIKIQNYKNLSNRKRLNFRHGYKNPRPHFCNRSTLIIHI